MAITIKIEDGKIVTSLYAKSLTLYINTSLFIHSMLHESTKSYVREGVTCFSALVEREDRLTGLVPFL